MDRALGPRTSIEITAEGERGIKAHYEEVRSAAERLFALSSDMVSARTSGKRLENDSLRARKIDLQTELVGSERSAFTPLFECQITFSYASHTQSGRAGQLLCFALWVPIQI